MGRIFALIGSGETSPTMVGVHRDLLARLALPRPAAVLLDTPYGFQENAEAVSTKARTYFAESVGLTVRVAPEGDDGVAAIRTADWVFTGPGSPSYALSRWRSGAVAHALADRIRADTGTTVLASAAAATAGRYALPVYEIYKVGTEPHWLDGLDLLADFGITAAVIPHYDNNEGRNYDTRYCYLGERRLARLERELPPEAAVVGIDEHTAVLITPGTGAVEVVGRGGLTIRRAGESRVVPSGTTLTLDDLRRLVRGVGSVGVGLAGAVAAGLDEAPPAQRVATTLVEITQQCEKRFNVAVDRRDADAMVRAILDLESAIRDWSQDTEEDEGTGQAGDVLRTLVVRLGEFAVLGIRDPCKTAGAWVDPLLALRDDLRRQRNYAAADGIRSVLTAVGVELRDGTDGTRWVLRPENAVQ